MSKWDKYKVLLIEEHKKKYDDIIKVHQEKKLIRKDLCEKMYDECRRMRQDEKYRNILSMPTNSSEARAAMSEYYDTYNPAFKRLQAEIENAIKEYNTMTGKYEKFRSAVYVLYDKKY